MILILIYLATLFGSGTGLVPDIEQSVKKHIKDQARSEQILVLNAAMLDAEKALQQDIKVAKKSLAELNGNRQAAEADLVSVLATLDARRAAARAKILDDRFRMKALMTADEWHLVYTPEAK